MTTDSQFLSNVMDAAAAALAQPAETTPAGVYEAHQCQTGCGRIANVIMVRIADSDLDIMCDVCAMMMWLAIADTVPAGEPLDIEAAPADDEQRTAPPAVNPE